MKVFKIILIAIIWVAVIAGCMYVKKQSNDASEVQKNYIEAEGEITNIVSSHANITDEEREVGSKVKTIYTLKLTQSIKVSYEADGEDYEYVFANLNPYNVTREDSFTTAERLEIEDTKGYQVGETFMLYIDEDNPSEPLDKKTVDHRASGSSVKVKYAVLVFLGLALSAAIFGVGPRGKKRYYR